MKILVILPTYNEEENIEEMLKIITSMGGDYHPLVVDDNSKDNTVALAQKVAEVYPRINIIRRKKERSFSKSLLCGIHYGIKHKFDYLFQMDADFSHDPRKLPTLLNTAKKYDFVIGSRYIKEGKILGWERRRRWLSFLGNLFSRIILNYRIHDWTSGFICWRRKAIQRVDLLNNKYPTGYSFLIVLKFRALSAELSFKETPITFKERLKGKTKMNKAIVKEAFWVVLGTKWRYLNNRLFKK